jgi:hypothetical protein
MKKAFWSLLFVIIFLFPVQVEGRVSIRSDGGVYDGYGEAWLSSNRVGEWQGDYADNDWVDGEWAVFHCARAGTAACATNLTPLEAKKVEGGSYRIRAAPSGERTYLGKHVFTVPKCGRVQYDIGTTKEGTVGGWVHNYGQDCDEVKPVSSRLKYRERLQARLNRAHERANAKIYGTSRDICREWAPINTEFRMHTGQDTHWMSGSAMSVEKGDRIDVNCFAKNGTALLPNAEMVIMTPSQKWVHQGAELRNYVVGEKGKHTFMCRAPDISVTCSDKDGFVAKAKQVQIFKEEKPRKIVERVRDRIIVVQAQRDARRSCDIILAGEGLYTAGDRVRWKIEDGRDYTTYIEELDVEVRGDADGNFFHLFESPGLYTLRAYPRAEGYDSPNACTETFRLRDEVGTTATTTSKGGVVQPRTGSSPLSLGLVFGSGAGSVGLWWLRKLMG